MTRTTALLLVAVSVLTGCRSAASTTLPTTTAVPSVATTTLPAAPVLRVAIFEDPTAANWWAALGSGGSAVDRVLTHGMTASLFTGTSLAPVPDLAVPPIGVPRPDGESWVVDQGIDPGRTWSDGEPITASDLVFYLETARAHSLDGGHVLADDVTVEAIDEHTLRFRFARVPGPGLWPGEVGLAPFVPAHHWRDVLKDAGDRLGLYGLKAPEPPRASDEHVEWVRTTSRERAYRMLAAGEVDLVHDPDGLAGLPGELRALLEESDLVATTTSVRTAVRALAMNLRHPPLDDPAFRQAVATLIDRAELAAGLGAVPAYSWYRPDHDVPAGPGTFDGERLDLTARLEAAVTLLTDAGYTWSVPPVAGGAGPVPGEGLRGPGGAVVGGLELMVRADDPVRVAAAHRIADRLSLLGVGVTVVPEPDLAGLVLPPIGIGRAEAWALAVVGWRSTGPSDPAALMAHLFHGTEDSVLAGGTNISGYSSALFDDLADRYRSTTSPTRAAQLAEAMEAILLQDVPQLLLYRETVTEAHAAGLPFAPVAGGIASDPASWPRRSP